MNHLRIRLYFIIGMISINMIFISPAEAGMLYHAAKKSVAKRILKNGFNPAKFKDKARFGKGLYLTKRRATAVCEKGNKSSVLKVKAGKSLEKKFIDFRKPTKRKLQKYIGKKYDLRGSVKKKIIGPKVARKIGKTAGNQNKAILYRSAKNGGTNIFIPGKTYQKYPKIVKPEKMIKH
jgi:hypothetical protein